MRDIPDEFIKSSRVAFPWNLTVDTPRLTGVPPHVLLMADIEKLKMKFEALECIMNDIMEKALDRRGVGGSEVHTNSILHVIKYTETRM